MDLAVDERADVLEQVRLLTNLETETQKLLQIILIGQPELRELLGRVELRQLAQRITGRYHLDPLEREETAAYVRHRLRVAGATREIFTSGALREVQRLSGGVPRLINIICDRALLGAFTEDRHLVRGNVVRRDLGEPVTAQIARDLRASIEYALAHRAPALAHAKQFNRGIGDERTDAFVGMYVNQWTVDYGPRGRQAVQNLLDRAFEAGIVPERVVVDFIG